GIAERVGRPRPDGARPNVLPHAGLDRHRRLWPAHLQQKVRPGRLLGAGRRHAGGAENQHREGRQVSHRLSNSLLSPTRSPPRMAAPARRRTVVVEGASFPYAAYVSGRPPVAVVVGATSKWQSDGRNTKLAHGRVLDDRDIPVGIRWGVGGAIAQKFAREG